MKKGLLKGILTLAAAISMGACSTGASGTVSGEYSYEQYSTTYNAVVTVTVENDIIKDVVIGECHNLSDANEAYGWTEEKRAVYTAGVEAYLASFEGKTVTEVMSIEVAVAESGSPLTGEEATFTDKITGTTQSSGRIILAIQNALEKL